MFSPLQNVSLHTLPNGLRILLKEDHAWPLVSLHGWVRVGSIDESESQAGISHVLEHMVFKGTARFKAAEISHAVESLGGSINAETAREYTHYHIDVPSAGTPQAVTLLGELLHRATIPAEQWRLERPVILEEIKRRNDDPDALLYDVLSQAVFKEAPLQRPVIGSPQTVAAITDEELRRYYRDSYAARRCWVVVVGDFPKRAMLRWLSEAFHDMRAGTSPPSRRNAKESYSPRHLRVQKTIQQTYVAFGFPTPPARHPDHEALDVLAALLGEGRSSRWVHALREKKKLVWSVSASNLTYEGPGLFAVFAECAPSQRLPLFKEFRVLLRQLRRRLPTEKELQRAKNMLQNSWLQGFETYHSQASTLGLFALEDDLERLRHYLDRVLAITRADLHKAIHRYFSADPFSSAVIEP